MGPQEPSVVVLRAGDGRALEGASLRRGLADLTWRSRGVLGTNFVLKSPRLNINKMSCLLTVAHHR